MIEFCLPPELVTFKSLSQLADYWTNEAIPWHLQDGRVNIGLAPFESFLVGPFSVAKKEASVSRLTFRNIFKEVKELTGLARLSL